VIGVLTEVLDAIQSGDGAMSLRALSRQLKVEPSALEGMIQHWVAKGRLTVASGDESDAVDCRSCGPTCYGDGQCPFVIVAPRVVSVVDERDGDT
jgi:hypothetical protein